MDGASLTTERPLRIGELAEQAGTTPRTIRYYEEIGLLGCAAARARGKHRLYTFEDLERLKEIIRLRDLLGLSLEQLSQLVEAETARADIRRELSTTEDPVRQGELLVEALEHISGQLTLVRERQRELRALERELGAKHQRVLDRLQTL